MAEKKGNPAASKTAAKKAEDAKEAVKEAVKAKVNKPATYVLYKLGEDRNLTFVTTAVGVGRNDAVSSAVAADKDLAGVPLVPVAESRLVQLAGALPEKPNIKVTQVV
jgi:hypothetical protein